MKYYNEFDPYAAQWLRNLIDAGHIPQGDVDSRSIKDVKASDLTGYTQCHFFAGLGGWSHALRLAGWPEDRPVWTGSCPCQPFSAAGSGGGVTDERHLWPTWFNLIRECRPDVIFGEQVEAAVNHGWLDLVQTDLEGEGYASGAVGIPAGGVGAPHIRQRLWFVGHTKNSGLQGCALRNNGESANGITQTSVPGQLADALPTRRAEWRAVAGNGQAAGRGKFDQLADADSGRHDGRATATGRQAGASTGIASGSTFDQLAKSNGFVRRAEQKSKQPTRGTRGESVRDCGPVSQLADAEYAKRGAERQIDTDAHGRDGLGRRRDLDQLAYTVESGWAGVSGGSGTQEQRTAQCGAASFWSDCDWLPCRDGKARPVEPGTFPLAHGVSGRVGRLRAYGNAIVPQVAQTFIEAYLES